MRRYLFIAVISAFLPIFCNAQEVKPDVNDSKLKYEARIGWSARTSLAMIYFSDNDYYIPYNQPLSYIYHDYHGASSSTNAISAEFLMRFNKKWSLSIVGAFNILWQDSYRGDTKEKSGTNTSSVLYLVPTVRLYYLDSPMIRLYGSLGIGVGKYIGFDSLKYDVEMENGNIERINRTLKFEGTLSPFGMEVGRKFYGFFEIGISTMYAGINLGAGYKF